MKYLTTERFSILFQAIGLACLLGYSGFTANRDYQMKALADTTGAKETAFELKIKMRNLWDDNATWSRTVLLCRINQLPGTEESMKRLLLNQIAIGNAFKPFYGVEAGRKLTLLLNKHILIAEEVVTAAKTKDSVKMKEINTRWYRNADEISAFLSTRNPDWSFADIKQMLTKQISCTTDQVEQRIKQNYKADIIAYDKVHDEMLKMSVILSDGIVKQFPEKFKVQVAETVSK